MSYGDTRRAWRRRANDRGFTVRGLSGEIRTGLVVGNTRGHRGMNNRQYAKIFVADEFAPIMFPVHWDLVKAIADGHVTEIAIKRNKDLLARLAS